MSVFNCSNNLTVTICKQVSEQQNVYPQNKFWGFLANFGHLFYAVNPNDYVYDDVTKVPDIFQQVNIYILIFILNLAYCYISFNIRIYSCNLVHFNNCIRSA